MNFKAIIPLLSIAILLTLALACTSQPTEVGVGSPSTGIPAAQTAPSDTAPEPAGPNTVLAAEKPPAEVPAAQTPTSPSLPIVPESPPIAPQGNPALAQSANGGNTGILVTGLGRISSSPDVAVLNLGVESFANTVAEARNQAATAMADVRAVLEAREVPDADIQSRYFRIHPRYTSREITRCPEAAETGTSAPTLSKMPEGGAGMQEGCFTERQRVISGYEVGNNLEVKLRDLDTVGEVIDEVTEAGGDSIRFNGIDFAIDDRSALEEQALAAAIEDALAKAQDVATTAGVDLGSLVHLSEGAAERGFDTFPSGRMYAMEAAASATLVSGGSLEVAAVVQALFSIDAN